MTKTRRKYIGISDLGYYIPDRYMYSTELAKRGNFAAKLLTEKVGVERIAIAYPDQQPVDLAVLAVQDALRKSQLAANDIDIIIFCGSGVYEYGRWSPAVKLQEIFGIKECYCFEIVNQCNSIPIALYTAKQLLLKSKDYHVALVVTSDIPSRQLDVSDPKTIPLLVMGDAGACALVVKTQTCNNELGKFYAISSPHAMDFMRIELGGTKFPMGHPNTFNEKAMLRVSDNYRLAELSSRQVEMHFKVIDRVLKNIKATDPKYLFVNQVNQSATENILNHYHIDERHTFLTLKDYGHLSSSDLLIDLAKAQENDLINEPGVAILASGGGAHSWSAIALEFKS